MSRLALICALEACEVGDYGLCVQILLGLLHPDEPTPERRCRCDVCDQSFEWPGLLDAHRHAHALDQIAEELCAARNEAVA